MILRMQRDRWPLRPLAAEQGDEADEALGGTVAGMEVPPHARAGQVGRRHRFAAYSRCSADVALRNGRPKRSERT
jgi:hypothetical protein